MKTLIAAVVAVLAQTLTLSAQTTQAIQFVVGPQLFQEGVLLTVDKVFSQRGTLVKGDTVTVKGKYQLTTHPEAIVLLTITEVGHGQRNGKRQSVEPGQRAQATGPKGEF